jgi:hypothetical protein
MFEVGVRRQLYHYRRTDSPADSRFLGGFCGKVGISYFVFRVLCFGEAKIRAALWIHLAASWRPTT